MKLQKYHHENNYFPFYDKAYPKEFFFTFYFYHGVCSNTYFEYDTFYNSFIVWFCWNLLALAIICTNGK